MASRVAIRQVLRCCNARSFSSTSHARAVSEFAMPSMSPTMESGKISSWKVKEGDKFSAGDVLLTVETDKAEVDVEAQDDGMVGKIIYDEKESSIQVGKIIALMAEEGDDISNLSAPSESSSSSSSAPSSSSSSSSKEAESTSSSGKDSIEKVEEAKSSSHTTSSSSTATAPQQADQHDAAPQHSRPLLPSVYMLLVNNGSPDISNLKGTGVRGQLTKGDILAFLGKIDNPAASASKLVEVSEKMDKPKDANKEKFGKGGNAGKAAAAGPQKIMSGQELRRWIAAGLAKPASRVNTPIAAVGFDDILDGYLPKPTYNQQRAVPPTRLPGQKDPWDELLGL